MAAPIAAVVASARVTGFCGLGAMGYHMAGHIARKLPGRCIVWTRSTAKAERHALEHGSIAATQGLSGLATADVVLLCLPTSVEDAEVAQDLAPHLARGACIVSCTSGEPTETKRLATMLIEKWGVNFLDAPVSGGPGGAKAGNLACMLGSNSNEAAARCSEALESFTAKLVRTGPAGSGHAVKSINNVLNVAHLMVATEGMLALQKLGVCPEVALSVINASSGRSLQTQERLPKEVLSRKFGYGFKMPLMAKDVRIAEGVMKAGFPEATLLPAVAKLYCEAALEEPDDADYTQVSCFLERRAGAELRPKREETPEPKRYKTDAAAHNGALGAASAASSSQNLRAE